VNFRAEIVNDVIAGTGRVAFAVAASSHDANKSATTMWSAQPSRDYPRVARKLDRTQFVHQALDLQGIGRLDEAEIETGLL
jgi:hypothetical protein